MTHVPATADLLAPGAQVRVAHRPSVVTQARRALLLVFCVTLGMNAFGSAAFAELRRPSRPAPVPHVAAAQLPSQASLRLDTGVVDAGQTVLVLRATGDAMAKVTVMDGERVVASLAQEVTAGVPLRVPVRVRASSQDRNLAVRAELVGGATKVLAVRVPAARPVQVASLAAPVAVR